MYQNYRANPPYGHGGHPSYGDMNSYHNTTDSYSTPGSDSHSGGQIDLSSRCNESEALSLLQHLDKDELQHLHDNDSKLQDLIDDLRQVKGIQQERDDLIATNKSLAEYNLSLQPKLEELKQFVAVDYEKINALKTNLAENKARLDGFVGRRSLDTLHALLQTETAKSEEESEELASNFFENGMDMEEFLNQYIPRRTEAHLRRIKSERMAELIRENQYSGFGSSSSSIQPAPPASVNSHPPYPGVAPMGGTPYPTSAAFGMPQPGSYHH